MKTIHSVSRSRRSGDPGTTDLAMLAHDVRGALQGVLGGVAILDDADLSPRAREQCDRVAAAAKNLARLVGPLLGEGRDLAETFGETIETSRFLAHVAKRWSGEAQERGVRLRVSLAPDAPGLLEADVTSLLRALGNLVANAMRHGAGDVEIEAGRAAGGGLVLQVRDEGPGLSDEAIEEALGRGMRPTEAGRAGLGLRIVRVLGAEMGAAFTLAKGPSGGLVAALEFPAALCRPAPAPAAPPEPASDLSGLRILLAEDNPTNQLVATQMLRALNAEVTLSADGVEAMEKFEAGAFDLVVVDIEMPRMTGLDVIRAIRSRSDGRETVPIVALTAYAMREHRDRIAAAGANGLVSKPVTSVESLGRALRVHVAPAHAAAPAGAAPAAPPADEPVADLEVFDSLCAAIGTGMMEELLDKVVADLSQARADLAGALVALDRKAIRSASHILISVAGAIGATRLQSCARALNASAHGEEGGTLPIEVRRCIDEIEAAIGFANGRRRVG